MSKNINKVYLPILFSAVLIIGIFLGKALNNKPHKSYAHLYQANDKLSRTINYIEKRYVDTVSRVKLEESAIPALLEELDPHSIYIPAKEMKSISEDMRGNFEGIGIYFNQIEDTCIITSVITGGPSDKVGILAGDRIIRINDSLVVGPEITGNDIKGFLKGTKGTKVTVSIERQNVPDLIDFEITRDKIPLYSVDVSYMIDDSTGYIKINRFSETTFKEFIDGAEILKKQDMQNLIIDLRGNTGGYMIAATNIADQFLESGKLIVYTEGKASPKQEIYSSAHGICKDIKVAILLDEFAASASEILAGAIQDNDRGKIIGRRSFGKGLVQEQYPLSDGSVIRLTIARYYTPTGRSIQKPYSENKKDYYNDLNERYLNGEFSEVDSIHLSDSLKFTTPGGNIVYGGGGIMPDIFVPLDTSGFSKYYAEVVSKGIIYTYAFEYVDDHRNTLSKFKNALEINDYLESINIFNSFADYAEEKGVSKSTKGFKYSKSLVNTRLKANIARNIIENEGYYPILNKIDTTITTAIHHLKNKNY